MKQVQKQLKPADSQADAEAELHHYGAGSNSGAAARAAAARAKRGEQVQPELDPVSAVEEEVRTALETHPDTKTVEVRKGDSFGRIAKRHGIPPVYIERLNPGVDSRRLKPGDTLKVPSAAAIESLPYTQMDMGEVPVQEQYEPGSESWAALFTRAAELVGVPHWMTNKSSRRALESMFTGAGKVPGENPGGWVMRPNERYGDRNKVENREQWSDVRDELREGRIEGQDHVRKGARSSAIGLGQLLVSNYDAYAPGGRTSMGDPLAEAIAMLNYIRDAYGAPEKAWKEKLATKVY